MGRSAGIILYASLVILIGLSMAAIWGYASLVNDLVSSQVSRGSRWFQLTFMVVTPVVFLVLVNIGPLPSSAAATCVLAGLFLIGGPMRMWILRPLENPRRPTKGPT